jgi:hypothetical protein
MPAETKTQPIPFGPALETSSEEISGGSPEAYNVILDVRGGLRKRPGIGAYTGVAPSTAVDAAGVLGLYLTEQRVAHTTGTPTVSGTHPGVLYAVGATVNASGGGHNAGRNVYRIVGGTATLVGTGAANEDRLSTPAAIATTRFPRPTFAETEALLVIAGGAEMGKIDIRPETFSAPNFTNPNPDYHEMSFLGGCPPLASHVFCNSSRICANDTQLDQTKVRYSNITQGIVSFAAHEQWDPSPGAAGFFTAEARADSVIACAENTNDIFCFGRTSLQLFAPDGSTTFAPSVTREVGCVAAYSPVKVDDKFYWLDHQTRIISSDGREWKDVGGAIQATLDLLTTPSDCYGYRFSESYADCIAFRFEEDEQTLVLQPDIGWARWAMHDAETDTFSQFPVLTHHRRQDGGVNVVGLEDGTIRTLSLENTTDLGEAIVAYVTTGFLDRESSNLKRTIAVHLHFKRTQALSEGVVCYLDYRDELSTEWTTLDIDLGVDDGNLTPTIPLYSLGTYRRRQWRFRFPDAAGLCLVRATETFEAMDN